MDIKPGFLTTEFWLTVVVAASALVKAFTGHDVGNSQTIAEAIAGTATGIYTIGRVVQKATHKTPAPVTYSTIATSPAAALVQQLATTSAGVPSQPASSASPDAPVTYASAASTIDAAPAAPTATA